MDADIPTPGPFASRKRAMPSRLMGDERLAQEVGAGSERAFNTLFQRYHQQLYRYCRGLTGTDQDAQDAVQTTFTKALLALREGRRSAPLRPWLYRIAHNESITAIRARVAVAGKVPLDLAANIGVSDRAEERERFATLVADLRELPEQQRGALVMRELSGLSHEEIAEALRISVGAAKQSILEARRSLLEFEEGRAMTCEDIQRIISDDDRRSLRSRRVRAHMRECGVCSAFAQAIPSRRADMLALWPVLPAASSAGLLAKITAGGTGSGHGGSGAGLAAGTAAKGIGATVSVKAAIATGAAVLTTATVGAVAVLHPHAAAPPASHGAATAGRKLSSHGVSVRGHGPAVTRAAAGAGRSNHRAVAKGLAPAANEHAAGRHSHGNDTTAGGAGSSSTAPGQTRNYGHSGSRSVTDSHRGTGHTTHGEPVKVNPSVVNKSANPNVGHGQLKPKTRQSAHVPRSRPQPPTKATAVAHTKTTAAMTHTRTTAVRAKTTSTATTPAKTRTTAAPTTTKTTAAPTATKTTAATTTTTGKPSTLSTPSGGPVTTTPTVPSSVVATSSTVPAGTPTPASTSVESGVGNGGTPAGQPAGSSGADKISK